ncbi:hypothetical protein OSB04_016741 [Centaurea solstitialis]|uniref:Uncharacterized protein n=1 Tax=Centaurea solstitialis TaxID=347529 RepID=A0AA38WLD2_9ASTR|nr:hypothetical protein OSB04_016741 [Centaurea solstitialis]
MDISKSSKSNPFISGKGTHLSATESSSKRTIALLRTYPVTPLGPTAEVSETVEVKSLIILGTIKAFSKDIPWFYMGCKRCSRKVQPTYIITDKTKLMVQVWLKRQKNLNLILINAKDKVSTICLIIVQDDTGIVSLTLFDREANKVLNKSTIELYEKIKEHGDLEMFPEDLNILLDRKFAIKIEVNYYNIKNSYFVYGISKLTDDENILNLLEIRLSAQRPAESDSVNVLSTDFCSMKKLKDVVSFTGENATPSNVDKSTADSPVSQDKAYHKKICKSVDLKCDLDEVYDAMKCSATKATRILIEKEEDIY